MSKLIALVVAIALIGTFAAISFQSSTTRQLAANSDVHIMELFNHWKITYNKNYATMEEEAHKFAVFKDNYFFVMNWNADPSSTSSVGLNEYADLNTAEFGALKGCLMPQPKLMEGERSLEQTETEVPSAAPASFNWATQGAVTPVKNQQQCGSCWAFSTTGTLEGLNFLNTGTLLSFSEQQLVDCSSAYGNEGCDGGWPFWALEYTAANGIELESQYPYTAQTGTCQYNASLAQKVNVGYGNVTNYNEVAMQTQLLVQPLSVCVEADQSVFQLYTGGVITSASCGTQLDHAILATGYSTTSAGQAYWIVKNSWGSSWGSAGYVNIAKSSSTNTYGICGIAMNVAFATQVKA